MSFKKAIARLKKEGVYTRKFHRYTREDKTNPDFVLCDMCELGTPLWINDDSFDGLYTMLYEHVEKFHPRMIPPKQKYSSMEENYLKEELNANHESIARDKGVIDSTLKLFNVLQHRQLTHDLLLKHPGNKDAFDTPEKFNTLPIAPLLSSKESLRLQEAMDAVGPLSDTDLLARIQQLMQKAASKGIEINPLYGKTEL